jgi:hypothetical protein
VKAASLRQGVVALAFVGLVGCGARSNASGVDGGGDAPPPPLSGRRSFDVVAVLGAVPGTMMGGLPPTVTFTLVLDADAHRAIVGGRGLGAVLAYTSDDGRRFSLPSFSVGLPSNGQCANASMLKFLSFSVDVSGSTMSGQAEGAGLVSCGDCQFDVLFQGPVTGTADVTAPVLFPTTIPQSPFDPFRLAASEPLPATATARLVGGDGSSYDLVPGIVPGDLPLVIAFDKPSIVLPAGMGFEVVLDGLVDFAGLHGAANTPLRLTSFPAMPLVAQDGFESVTAPQVGGATVISDGPLPPITGMRSVYFGAQGAPAPGGVQVGGSLGVRLSVPAGATKLAFSYRMVGQYAGSGFAGSVSLGSVGRTPATSDFTTTPTGTPTTWPDGRTVWVTDVASKEISLPADVTDELLVAMEPFGFGCGGPAPPMGGMLLDDLRVE